MPLDSFDIRDDVGGASPDRTGMELPDAASAGRETLRLAGATIADRAPSGGRLARSHLDATGHDGGSMMVTGVPGSPPSATAAAR